MTKKHEDTFEKKADVTNEKVQSEHGVSRTEHAMGSRQPDGEEVYGEMTKPAPLAGRDVPQKIITAENDTPTPGEDNEVPTGKDTVNRSATEEPAKGHK